MNLLIIGQGRHGKDTVAEILRDDFGLTFKSSSEMAYEIFIFDVFKEKYGYVTLHEAYEDRHNHRAELFQMISQYNTPDKTKLAREIVEATGMYVGMRCKEELQTCIDKEVFDMIIWVDASKRVSYVEDSSSITVDKSMADVIIYNNGSLDELRREVLYLVKGHNLA